MHHLVVYVPELDRLLRWYQRYSEAEAGGDPISMTQLIMGINDRLTCFVEMSAELATGEAYDGISVDELEYCDSVRIPTAPHQFDLDLMEEYVVSIAAASVNTLVDSGWLIDVKLLDAHGDLHFTFEHRCPHL